MTSRIQGDGEGKESKWADIDDDEDDWAPETIEWGDGTKVTLNQPDAIPPPTQGNQAEILTDDKGQPLQPTKILSPLITTKIGPNATVLKLGASAERQQAQKAATLQKGPAEKATSSVTKPSAPPPSKSPWAPLPPVDKISPVVINPQIPMPPPPRYLNNQGNTQSPSGISTQSPAHEISADDFNRSWRENQHNQPRELYMPTSGKYEAVSENRRRGSRNDQNFRAPALLQRPSQSDQHAPAEPSAAFQTHRNNTDQERAPWARRRASSNLSGTSGQYGRRMSVTKPGDLSAITSDVLQERRGSHATGTDSVGSSQDMPPQPIPSAAYKARGFSPAHSMTRQPSSSGDQRQSDAIPAPAAPQDIEADRALQKQLMREKRELAIKRRQEEEERLEAEKKERIRLKLEAMGPPPEKPKSKEPSTTSVETPTAAVEVPAAPQSPPKPPFPDASGVPTQYGMMKLHPPDTAKRAPQSEQPSETPASIEDSRRISDTLADIAKPSPVLTNGMRPASDPQADKMSKDMALNDRTVQSTRGPNLGPDTRSAWPSSRMDHRSPPTSNLWGIPSSNKALGNGTFDQNLASFPSRDFGAREPGWTNGRPIAPERSPQLASATSQVPQDRVTPVPFIPIPEQSPLAAGSEVDSVHPQSRPAPIGPPQASQTNQRWQASPNMRPATSGVAAWNDFQNVAAREDRAENDRLQRELASRLEEEARTGGRRAPQYAFNETWKQVEIGDQAGQRQVTGIAQSNFVPSIGSQFGAVGSLPGADLGSRSVTGMPARGSRFFPHLADGMAGQNKRAVTYNHPEVPRTPSPPVAEEYGSGHPAFDGDLHRPVVQLPPEKPVVKLPPPQTVSIPPTTALPSRPPPRDAPRSFAAAVKKQPSPPSTPQPLPQPQSTLRTVSQPIASTSSWQDRFNGLLGRQPKSPEKKHTQALAVSSSSREPLDVVPLNILASVSLPQIEDDILKDAGKATSKDVEDENDIFEDRELGSMPTVKVPQEVPAAVWHPARVPVNNRSKNRVVLPADEPYTVIPFMFDISEHHPSSKKGDFVIIHLPGSTKPVRKDLPGKVSSSSTSRSRSSRNTSSTFNSKPKRGGGKSRETSATNAQPSQSGKSSQSQSPRPNGTAPSPRPAQSHSRRWHPQRPATGVAH